MSKLTKDELVEMKAIGYIEGNSGTVPDALKVGQEMRDKIDAHEADLAKKTEAPNDAAHNHVAASPKPAHADQPVARAPKTAPKKRQAKAQVKTPAPSSAPVREHHTTPPAVQRDDKDE